MLRLVWDLENTKYYGKKKITDENYFLMFGFTVKNIKENQI